MKKINNRGKDNPFYGKHHTEESKRKISESKKGIPTWNKGKKGVMPEPWNKGKKGLQIAWNKGKTYEETYGKEEAIKLKEKVSISTKKAMKNVPYEKLAYWKGKEMSKTTKEKSSKSHKGKKTHEWNESSRKKASESHEKLWKDPEYRRNQIKARKGKKQSEETKEKHRKASKKLWKDPEFARKVVKAQKRKPTKPEIEFVSILNNYFPEEFKYVGDGEIWIGGKNPDFFNINGKKQVIELYGLYWHSFERTGNIKEEEEQQRIDHFSKYGYKTLIVWENELENLNRLKKKIQSFLDN